MMCDMIVINLIAKIKIIIDKTKFKSLIDLQANTVCSTRKGF